MTTILFTAVNAVFPIVLLILFGYFLKRKNFFSKDFLKNGNKLVFKICLPITLFINVYNIESFAAVQWDLVIYSLAAILILFGVGMLIAVSTTKRADRRGVILQCVFRSNFAIIGLPLASALGGAKAVGVASIISAFSIPAFNILAVIALTIFVKKGDEKSSNKKDILLNIVQNPLIIGVMTGMLFLALRTLQISIFGEVVFSLSRDLQFLYTTLNNLKAITTPLALIVLGGQFEFSAVKGLLKEIIAGTLGRIIVAPVIGIGGAYLLSTYTNLLSCGVYEYPTLVSLFGTPVAVASAIMAGSMDNDEQLAAQLVVWTSICSVITMFVIVCIMMALGLLQV